MISLLKCFQKCFKMIIETMKCKYWPEMEWEWLKQSCRSTAKQKKHREREQVRASILSEYGHPHSVWVQEAWPFTFPNPRLVWEVGESWVVSLRMPLLNNFGWKSTLENWFQNFGSCFWVIFGGLRDCILASGTVNDRLWSLWLRLVMNNKDMWLLSSKRGFNSWKQEEQRWINWCDGF